MTKSITVISRDGKQVERGDGVMLDGDKLHSVRVPVMFMDGASSVSAATLASAAQLLGDSYNEAEISKLSDEAARHAVVRKRIGPAANGRSAAYLDAAWGALAGTGSPMPSSSVARPIALSDEQAAMGREGVRRALADHARDNPPQSGVLTDAERKAGRDRIRGSYVALKAEMADGWKPQAQREAEARSVALDPRVEKAFRDGKITDNTVTRAKAEMARTLENGWKEGRV